MTDTTYILIICASIGSGYIAADMHPDIRGVGVTVFALVAIALFGVHRLARWLGKQ